MYPSRMTLGQLLGGLAVVVLGPPEEIRNVYPSRDDNRRETQRNMLSSNTASVDHEILNAH